MSPLHNAVVFQINETQKAWKLNGNKHYYEEERFFLLAFYLAKAFSTHTDFSCQSCAGCVL